MKKLIICLAVVLVVGGIFCVLEAINISQDAEMKVEEFNIKPNTETFRQEIKPCPVCEARNKPEIWTETI